MVVGRPVTIARRQSKNPFYRITRGRVADCMPAENHEKKKEKGGEGEGMEKGKKGRGRGRKKKRANRSSEARPLRFIIRPSPLRDPLRGFPSIGRASLFLASSLSPALATLDLAPPRQRSVCHFHPDDRREMESYWMKQRERMKRGRGEGRGGGGGGAKGWNGGSRKKGNELFSSIRHGRTHTPWTRRTRGVS